MSADATPATIPGVETLPPSARRRAAELASELRGLALRLEGAQSVRMLERIAGQVGQASVDVATLVTTVRQALGTSEVTS